MNAWDKPSQLICQISAESRLINDVCKRSDLVLCRSRCLLQRIMLRKKQIIESREGFTENMARVFACWAREETMPFWINLESYDCNARSKTNTFALDPLELILEICGVEDNDQKCVHNLRDLPQSEGAVGTIERIIDISVVRHKFHGDFSCTP